MAIGRNFPLCVMAHLYLKIFDVYETVDEMSLSILSYVPKKRQKIQAVKG